MKRVIRPGMFETASSAIHSMVISEDGLSDPDLPVDKKTGKVKVPLTYLGKEHEVYSTQLEKLTFLLTLMYCIGDAEGHYTKSNRRELTESMYEDYRFVAINDAVKNYRNFGYDLSIVISKKNVDPIGADHQIYNEVIYGEFPYINIWDEKSIQNFIFNKYIAVETDCD